MRLDSALIFVHIAANIFWIGAIVGVGVLLLADKVGDAKTRGELALRLYMRVATPGFVLSFLFGVVRFGMDIGLYAKMPFMHIKLTFALAVIAFHHIIGARAKKMANGDETDPGKTGLFVALLALCAVVAVFFVVMRIPAGSAG